jgi:molecular chaperone GrpE
MNKNSTTNKDKLVRETKEEKKKPKKDNLVQELAENEKKPLDAKTKKKSELETKITQLEQENVNLQKEIKTEKDKNLRLLADLENQRKQIGEIIKYSNERLIEQLLFFPDNYEEALKAFEKSKETDPSGQVSKIQGFLTGFQMILTEFKNFLKRQGVEEIKITPLKDVYDDNNEQHKNNLKAEKEVNDKYPPGTILQVVRKGYLLHQRVLRRAEVKISQRKK